MEGIIDSPAGEVFGDREIDCFLIFPRAERDESEVVENGFSDKPLNVGG
jgi:hypothetical protein